MEKNTNIVNKKVVLLHALLFFIANISFVIMISISTSIFSQKVGPQAIAYIYIVNAFIHFFIATFITISMSKYSVLKMIRWILLVCFVIMIMNSLLIFTNFSERYIYTFLIITAYRIGTILLMSTWISAAQFFSGIHAKKFYPTLITASALGSLIGCSLMAFLSKTFSINCFILFCALCLFLCFIIIVILEKYFWYDNTNKDTEEIDADFMQKILQFIFTSRSWLTILVIATILQCFSSISYFEFIFSVHKNFDTYEKMNSYLGYFGITASIFSILFGLLSSRIILKFGIWDAMSFIVSSITLSFLILVFSGNEIYLDSFSRILILAFTQLGLMITSILCKHAKLKYQNQVTSIFNFLPNVLGTLIAGQLCYLLDVLSFSTFSLLMVIILLASYFFMKSSKETYRKILMGGIENELNEKLKVINKSVINESISIESLYSTFLNKKNPDIDKLSIYEINAKVSDPTNIKIILNTIRGLKNKHVNIRKKALTNLNLYLSLGDSIIPWLIDCTKDDDIEIAGRSLIMLNKIKPESLNLKPYKIIKTLIDLDNIQYKILALNVIQALKLTEYINVVKFSMNSQEEKIRKHAYLAYASLATIDHDDTIKVLKSHLNEQSILSAKALIQAINTLVIKKKDAFYEFVFHRDIFTWKNTTELLIRWECESEYQSIILSAINKMHLVYENLAIIDFFSKYESNYYANVLIQHLILTNETILKGIIYIVAFQTHDESIVDSLYKELKNINPTIKATALELIDNLGDKAITKHINAYFTLSSNEERLEYSKKTWRIESFDTHNVFERLLLENDFWIKVCCLYIIKGLKDPFFKKIISHIIETEKEPFVKDFAKSTLIALTQGDAMSEKKSEIDALEIVVFLKNCKAFESIHLNTLAFISKLLNQKSFSKGESIVKKGETVTGMYILFSGKISIDNKFLLEKSSFFCLHSMIQKSLSPETIIADTDVTALFLPRKMYENIIILYPEVAIGLLQEMAAYICMIEQPQ